MLRVNGKERVGQLERKGYKVDVQKKRKRNEEKEKRECG